MKRLLLLALLSTSISAVVTAQNVGIGTTTPTVKLEVAGAGKYSGDLAVIGNVNDTGSVNTTGNITAAGNVTAHGGGVMYNGLAATNLKVISHIVSFTVQTLQAHTLSSELQINIGPNIYASAPMIFVGDIVNAATTLGPLYQLQLITYGATATYFKVRILNNSDVSITQGISWNVMYIGTSY